MLSGRWRHPHFSAKYSADLPDQFCTHCRTPSIIRQTCPAASNIWRALSRLAHPTSKKGTSIATSAHFAAVRGVLCVQCFRFISIRALSSSRRQTTRQPPAFPPAPDSAPPACSSAPPAVHARHPYRAFPDKHVTR